MAIKVINVQKNTWTKISGGLFSFQVIGDKSIYYTDSASMPSGIPPHHVESKIALPDVEYNYKPSTILNNLYVYSVCTGSNIAIDKPTYFDVFLQDQTSPPIEYFLTQDINDVTITATSPARTKIINLQAGHGFLIGEFIEIYIELEISGILVQRFEQLQIVATTATTITTGQFLSIEVDPINVVFSRRVTADLNVDGSVTAQRFKLGPPGNLEWDITRTIGSMILDSQPDDGLFGNLPALTNGIFLGGENDLAQLYLVNVYTNAGFRLTCYDVEYTTRSVPQGSHGMTYRKSFGGQDKYGVVIRLCGPLNEEFVCYVQDNLTDLTQFRMKLMGHEVQ